MNDTELDALERVLKNMIHGSVLSQTQTIKPDGVLELIAELRQTRKERDWLAHHFDQRPCERDDQCAFKLSKRDCHQTSQQCWIDAAKSGVEAAKEAVSCQAKM